ncbi:MAG: hypothetical protein IJL02_09950 [Methanobrevibacter sp.]|uniref:hypothetical protein n=1 Tax=Methanobrevibacter sp. TaxID=66852 RepID=UPI0025FA1527|nr:hypothetical protein [Methanobrevibacter sp.]MBQ6100164.1 hypothetical protein [Methanobrevibacter sp.]
MPNGTLKNKEIKRLTTPLTFKNSKAYDCEGNLISCVETLSDVRFIIEPKEGILTEDEIMQYAPDSKAASKIRLNRGLGNMEDVLLVHESVPWIFGLYYILLVSVALPIIHAKNTLLMIILLILFILPLVYSYYIFNIKNYEYKPKKLHPLPKPDIPKATKEPEVSDDEVEVKQIESLKGYEREVNNLKVLFDVKEGVVRDLIKKRFEPPQITYDKFIAMVDSCHNLFYTQVDSATNIVNLAVEDSPRIRKELDNKITNMKTIIDQIEELTNELVINISSENESEDDVNNLLNDMENLIDSVKEY